MEACQQVFDTGGRHLSGRRVVMTGGTWRIIVNLNMEAAEWCPFRIGRRRGSRLDWLEAFVSIFNFVRKRVDKEEKKNKTS
jgi:hypothetical protein